MTTVGSNPQAARYAGISVERQIVLAMALGGGLAGLAGAFEILGVKYRLFHMFSPGYGFDGIVVAFMASANPVLVPIAALFFSGLRSGAQFMQRAVGVDSTVVDAIQGLVVIFVAASLAIRFEDSRWGKLLAARRTAEPVLARKEDRRWLTGSIRRRSSISCARACGSQCPSPLRRWGASFRSGRDLQYRPRRHDAERSIRRRARRLSDRQRNRRRAVRHRARHAWRRRAGHPVDPARNVNQIVCGIAINLVAIGLTAFLARLMFGLNATTQSLPGFTAIPIPLLSDIPILGPVFFNQDPLIYLLYLLAPALYWLLYRSTFGLDIRATGENPAAADSAGVPVFRIRMLAVLISGALAGLGGAYIVVSQVFVFTEHMSAGKGFIALAAIILGRWDPIGALLASWFFGFCEAVQLRLQFANPNVPYQVFTALPYVASILALIGVYGRFKPPASVGIPYRRESKT